MQVDDRQSHPTRRVSDGEQTSRAQTKSWSTEVAKTEPVVSGWVDCASWLSDDILLLVGWFRAKEDSPAKVRLTLEDRIDDHAAPLESRCFSYPRAGFADTDSRAGKVITARFLRPEDVRRPLGSVVIQQDTTPFALGPLRLSQAMTDLQTLAREGFAWLDYDSRAEVMEFLVSTLTEHRETKNGLRLSKNLFVIREALRERLPEGVISQDEPRSLAIDTMLGVDEKSFYVRGWMRDEEAEVAQLTAVAPEGTRVELLERIFRYPRPDVEQFYGVASSDLLLAKSGFISYFELEAPSRLSSGWTFEMRTTGGEAIEVAAPSVVKDPLAVRNAILADIFHERPPYDDLIPNHVFPAVSGQQNRLRERVGVQEVIQYGTQNEAPEVSVIVPLYQRIDFLEQQLAQFVHDPEILQAELIYVLDSPELADNLKDTAAQLFALYRMPFKVVMLEQSAGFSAVNNVGASLARGRLLLLLNSDVLPDKPGWLGKMTEFYDATPGIGALAPKLLYEDDSLQHAGLHFYRQRDGLWNNEHYFKGLHRDIPAANTPRPVPAITGACMMIDNGLYERFGGLRGIYVQGDYEDSDLCLRLIEAGRENWYLPDAELYHLEGQSYGLEARQLNGRYNTWLHTRLWRERIEAIMDRYAAVSSSERTASRTQGQRARGPSAAATSSTSGQDDDAAKGSRVRPEKRSERQAGKKSRNK
jgi:GT2 family glycosyltransferase